MTAILRQNSFLEVIQSDTNTDILNLDTKTRELESLQMIISNLKSTNILIYLSSCL